MLKSVKTRFAALPILLTAALTTLPALADDSSAAAAWAALGKGAIVLLRHANAPGVGDPPGFKLDDCATQRNLDAAGREQALGIGSTFKSRNVKVGAVYTSQWCRCIDTAELAFPGLHRQDSAFNSFFENRTNEPAQTTAARAKLLAWRGPGALVVVTHQVNISALTGLTPTSGEGVVLQRAGGALKVVGRITP
jgi:phosphohistidine phosphatase SixA